MYSFPSMKLVITHRFIRMVVEISDYILLYTGIKVCFDEFTRDLREQEKVVCLFTIRSQKILRYTVLLFVQQKLSANWLDRVRRAIYISFLASPEHVNRLEIPAESTLVDVT